MNTCNIYRYLWLGKDDRGWYAECRALFIDLFGEERLDLICKLFAATSINTSLQSNITLFRRALYEIENGLPVGNYLPNIQMQLQLIREGKPLSGRKISSFARAMAGDENAVVVDLWQMRAFGYKTDSPTKRQYDLIEDWTRKEAAALKLKPAELSAMIWTGIRIDLAGNYNRHYTQQLRHQLTNLFNVI